MTRELNVVGLEMVTFGPLATNAELNWTGGTRDVLTLGQEVRAG